VHGRPVRPLQRRPLEALAISRRSSRPGSPAAGESGETLRETGVAPEVGELSSEEIEDSLRERMSGVYQELTGIEILFEATPC